jgi:phospho-N-acetylmuramoyl-pentapeptide-transferase
MSPLHHHFELSGWSENKLVTVFSAITLVCSALAFWGILGRY